MQFQSFWCRSVCLSVSLSLSLATPSWSLLIPHLKRHKHPVALVAVSKTGYERSGGPITLLTLQPFPASLEALELSSVV